ncbi:hypothetical protein [Endozoicomonas sp. ONNA1]|uniref:hypothetical protein n=1 Tax=Endozoicomonas sp. ONNA1 TaxID=2828740 RepID=UPI0021479459|nr:hypothetical protein [Endozoicomonas sp. ONNA1]
MIKAAKDKKSFDYPESAWERIIGAGLDIATPLVVAAATWAALIIVSSPLRESGFHSEGVTSITLEKLIYGRGESL